MIDQYPSPNGVLTSLIWRKTAAGGETSLSGYDNASQALSYTPGQEQVYLNGILLVRGDDYTATNGTSITGLAALTANDFVQINCYNNFSVATLPSTSITGEITNSQITSLATSKLTGTITNAQLAGSISNDKLTNSSITINGSAVSLGGSTTIAGGSAQDDAPTSPTEGQLWLDTNGTLATTGFVEKGDIGAKGDLFVGSANDTVSILNVGESGSTIVSDSSTSTGLRWQGNYAAGKNKIINGDFAINQRGFTSGTSNGYGQDRWLQIRANGTVTYSVETFTLGAAPVAGYEAKNFARQVVSGHAGSATDYAVFAQRIESVRTLANQTATVSFWAKAASGTPKIAVTLRQSFGTGGSPSSDVDTYVGQVTLSTSWARYSVTVAIPSISGKTLGTANDDQLVLYFFTSAGSNYNSITGSLGSQNGTFDFWGVQLEAGSVATAFQTATGNPASELAACQRYYYQIGTASSAAYEPAGLIGVSPDTGSFLGPVQYPVAMRTSPTVTTTGTWELKNHGIAINSATISTSTTLTQGLLNWNGSGLTAWRSDNIRNQNSPGALIRFSAEL